VEDMIEYKYAFHAAGLTFRWEIIIFAAKCALSSSATFFAHNTAC
jgi:hypothetical protein